MVERQSSTKLLICDLDNTLYDWVGYFVPSFYAMVDKATELLKCDRERLLDDLRVVHQMHDDSEHPFALLDTETVRQHFSGFSRQEMAKALDDAFYAFNSTRKKTLRLHNGVIETLQILQAKGVMLIAHTDSKLYAAYDRLSRLELLSYFNRIYCRERSASIHPDIYSSANWESRIPMAKITELSNHQSKPNVSVLLEICEREQIPSFYTAYIGDSLTHDILMANQANVYSIWAEYGARHDPALYSALVRISHWTPARVEREMDLKAKTKYITPSFIAENGFSDLLSIL